MAHEVHDQRHKALLGAFYDLWAVVEFEREVSSQKQAIDLVVTPRPDSAGDHGLPLLHRMSAAGTCMFEIFHNTPGLAEMDACVRKQLVYHQSLILHARRANRARPAKPILWILSSGMPETALAHYEAREMEGWPPGFWQTRDADAIRIVAINRLPATRETLIVRLSGRGPTLRDALTELDRLPPDAIEHRLAVPVLLEIPGQVFHDLLEEEELNILQQIRARHEAWEYRVRQEGLQEGRRQGKRQGQRQGKRQGKRELLLRLLSIRFTTLPEDTVERLKQADDRQLERWAERILSAERLEQIFDE